MTVNFDKLGKKLGLNEEAQAMILTEWETKLSEARGEIAAELREEFSKKFTHDKNLVIESVDKFLSEQLQNEISELAEDKKKLIAERVQYKKNIKEHTNLMNEFIMRQLAGELNEHQEERKAFKKHLNVLEDFVLKQLAEELKEFHDDRAALQEQRVKLVRQGKAEIVEAKKKFITRAASVIEGTINKSLKKEINQFRNDIQASRENDFGRRVFEAFAGEYMTSYLNEGSEVKKLQSTIAKKDEALNEAKVKLVKQSKLVEGARRKVAIAEDQQQRGETMSKLLAPLGAEKKGVMSSLLESVQTKDLDKAYNKYLPAVLNEQANTRSKKKETITEDVLSAKTGDRASHATVEDDNIDEFAELKKLAGI